MLKNIAMRYAYEDTFRTNFETYMSHIQQIEQSLFSLGSVDATKVSMNAAAGAVED